MRIEPNGRQSFFPLPINKSTFLSSFNANEVYVMSNEIASPPAITARLRVDGDEVKEITEFVVSTTGGYWGETLVLPDGRILIGNSGQDGIQQFDSNGGESIGYFVSPDAGIRVRSMTYIPEIDKIITLGTDQQTISRIDLEGNIEDQVNAADFLFPSLWGVARMPGTTNIIVGSHDGPVETKTLSVSSMLPIFRSVRGIRNHRI